MACFDELPDVAIYAILSHLELRRDLAICCLVSKNLKALATSCLYHTVYLGFAVHIDQIARRFLEEGLAVAQARGSTKSRLAKKCTSSYVRCLIFDDNRYTTLYKRDELLCDYSIADFQPAIPYLNNLTTLAWRSQWLPEKTTLFTSLRSHCSRLRSVEINNWYHIFEPTPDHYADSLFAFTNLDRLAINSKFLAHGQNRLPESILAAIRASPNLKSLELDLGEPDIGKDRTWSPNKLFKEVGLTFPELHTLRLGGRVVLQWPLTLSKPATPFRLFFEQHPMLQSISIAWAPGLNEQNDLGPETVISLFPSLRHFEGPAFLCVSILRSPLALQLESLSILDKQLGISKAEHINKLSNAAESLPKLSTLNFYLESDPQPQYRAIREISRIAPNLREICVQGLHIDLRMSIVEALRHAPNLRKLTARVSIVTPKALRSLLSACPRLEELQDTYKPHAIRSWKVAFCVATAVQSTNGADFSSQTFDYLIVGGGTAGLALAARLSEKPKVSVGVIEAGSYYEDDPLINTPSLAGQLQGNAKYDWLFKSAPQSHVNNRILPLPRGKALGGSSAINLMVFNRASKTEYDAWEKLGSPQWNWNNLLPYMKRAERFTGIDPFRANYTHANPSDIFPSQGTNGTIAASFNTWYSDVIGPYGEAAAKLGVPINFDPDSGDPFGLYNSGTAVNRTTGKRSYAANTYFAYNSGRRNFVVLTGAQATKLEFSNSASGKLNDKLIATGVSFVHNSTTYSVKVKKEVILSAGTFQTPQLLELSGIGNSTILRQNGVTPLVDLPGVGENLQDHLFLPSTYELKPGKTTFDILRNNATYAAAAQAQYATTHDGIYTSSVSIVSFLNLNYITTSEELSNMTAKLNQEIAVDKTTALQNAQYTIQKDWLNKRVGHLEIVMYPGYFGSGTPKANTSYISLLMATQHPFSRGHVHINSSDPLAAPQINPNYFSKSIDQETLVQALKFGLKISQSGPLATLVVARQDPPLETTSNDAYIEYAKANIRSIHHPIGTAALAPRAIGGVVDPSLKVYGTLNVRVVDASIIPIHIGTHLSRTVYGIAERAAAIIANDSG
ncbi:unnamed protein product [Rhizoctonia solani]|uniref:Glucose-methanol-choline oxidoreductase N-terminal domain-containing protein n=1 Tax=Rhizoctonia solani TaxID=456999 RepID=A0A8H3EBF0_9AGAM|nr:unnamed protein product [Rhizoctonia solani]